MDIFKNKYRGWHLWETPTIPNSSWFYKSISKTASFLKPNLKILSYKTVALDLWKDPCIFDLPIMLKPTCLNMSISLEEDGFTGLLDNNSLNFDLLENLFGYNLNWDWINRIIIDSWNDNPCVWGPKNSHTSIASLVYSYMKSDQIDHSP